MNQQNILEFITQANLSGLNAINAGLAQQAQQLKSIAAASSGASAAAARLTQSYRQAGAALRMLAAAQNAYNANLRNRTAGGQFAPGTGVPQSFYQQQLAAASSFAKRMQLILAQALLVPVGSALNAMENQIRSGLASMTALAQRASLAIQQALTFPNLARNLAAAFRGLGAGLGAAVVAGAQAGGNAIRSLIVGAINAASAAARTLTGILRNIKGGIGNLGIVGALGLIGGVRAAFEVDKALAKINTIARANKAVLDDIALGLQRIAAQTGTEFDDLAQGYYDLLSAGLAVKDGNVQVGQSLKLMQDAADLARGGIGSVKDSLDFLTTALNAFRGPLTSEFGDPLKASTALADAFAKSVELGKVTVQELAPVFSTAAPLAAQLGVSFREMAAILAAMTQQGFDAGEAFTALRSALVGAQRDTKKLQQAALTDTTVKNALASVGAKDFLQFIDKAGFQRFAAVLREYSERAGVPLIKLLGRIEGVQAILAVTGAQADNYKQILDEITSSSGNAAEQAALFNDSLSAQLRLFRNALFAVGDALFRRRIIDPLKDFVKALRDITLGVLDFVVANKQLFDVLVPVFALFTSLAALTKGASAIENIFLRLPGPISGFAVGIGLIGRSLALVLGPLGIVIVGVSTLRRLVDFGVLPLKTFGAVLADISELATELGEVLGGLADYFRQVLAVIMDPGPLSATVIRGLGIFFSETIERALDQATAAMHLLIDDFVAGVVDLFSESFIAQASSIADALFEGFHSAVGYVVPRIASTLSQLLTFGSEVITNLVQFGADVASGIGQSIIDALPKAAEFISGIPQAIGEAFGAGTGGSAVFNQLDEWARSFIGWWQQNGPALAQGILDVLRSAADVVVQTGRRLFSRAGDIFGGMFDWLTEHQDEIIGNVQDFIGGVVDAISSVAQAIVPPLAGATGALVDWVAAAIPGVLGAIARFIDEVVRAIVPLGEDSGPVGDAMANVGGQLIKWITDRIPGAIGALLDWTVAVENWIITVLAPRIVAVFVGIGAGLVKALLDGILAAFRDPGTFVARTAELIYALLAAAVIIAAASSAGALVGAAFGLAVGAARSIAGGLAGVATRTGAILLEEGAAAATAAGLATSAAFVAAVAIPVAATIIVALKIRTDIQQQQDELKNQVAGFVKTSALEGIDKGLAAIRQARSDLDTQRLQSAFGGPIVIGAGIVVQWGVRDTLDEAEKLLLAQRDRLLNVRQRAYDVPVTVKLKVTFTSDDFVGPLTDAQQKIKAQLEANRLNFTADEFVGPLTDIQQRIRDSLDITPVVEDFKGGLNGIVDIWNATPGRLKTAADQLREALKKPFDLKAQAQEFATDYALIQQAMTSNNPLAIARANELKTALITAANQTNAAFLAAGEAPPYLVDAITGQITPATTAATGLANGVTTQVDKIPTSVTGAGNAFQTIPLAIITATPPTAAAAANFANAALIPIQNTNKTIVSSTSGTFHAYPAAISAAAPAAGTAANKVANAVEAPLVELRGQVWSYGYSTGTSYVSAMSAAVQAKTAELRLKVDRIRQFMEAGSPPGPESPLHRIDVWGYKTGEAWIDNLVSALETGPQRVARAVRATGVALASSFGSPTLAFAAAPAPAFAPAPTFAPPPAFPTPAPVAAGTLGGGALGTTTNSTSSVTISPGAITIHARPGQTPKDLGQTILDEVAKGLRDQTARSSRRVN